MVCEHCNKEDETAALRENPYDADVNNESIMEIICDHCHEELCADI